MKSYCTQNNGDCPSGSLSNYGRDCRNNSNWGGKRPGSGRKPTGRKRINLFVTPEEEAILRKQLEVIRNKEEKKMTNYDKDTFIGMIEDWQADNAPQYDDLTIGDITNDGGKWQAYVTDDKTAYTLADDGTGNIVINYLGTK